MTKRIFTLVLALAAMLVALPSAPAQAAKRLPGIDISSWQGTIDWDKVGASDVRFIIMRVAHGIELDTRYAEYSAGAEAQDIPWTGYMYVEPDGAKGSAVEQADLFVDNAALVKGNILPVIDVEETGGLGRERLSDWVAQWLNRVRNRMGVKPIIYTSPYFWQTYLGDTRRFARRGYELWVANWEVSSPTVPAGNWSGHGWTFWQWTDCGSVSGIKGCVDKDRFNGTAIGPRFRIP